MQASLGLQSSWKISSARLLKAVYINCSTASGTAITIQMLEFIPAAASAVMLHAHASQGRPGAWAVQDEL
jgi:hypothetical protein